MITPDDNGYERLKRWREKHKGLSNLRQREYRRKKSGAVGATELITVRPDEVDPEKAASDIPTVQDLRELIKREETRKLEERAVVPVVKPKVFLNDITGQVISEAAWVELQRRKAEAKLKEYELDEYSQT